MTPDPTEPKGIRYYRERLQAITQTVADLRAPIREGNQHPPAMIEQGLTRLLDLLDELDREWAKSDDRSPAPLPDPTEPTRDGAIAELRRKARSNPSRWQACDAVADALEQMFHDDIGKNIDRQKEITAALTHHKEDTK